MKRDLTRKDSSSEMLYEYRYIIDVGMEHGMKTLYLVLQFKNLHMRWITL